MNTPLLPGRGRRATPVLLLSLLLAASPRAGAEDPPDAGVALELEQAVQLAVEAQPLLQALAAQARAARESAVAAAQLPDPQLMAGLLDLPINTDDAYSLRRDSDTRFELGLSQEFPRADKRRLRGEQGRLDAHQLDAEQDLSRRSIRRDAALAWLDLWRYDQALGLARAGLREAQAQLAAVELALRTSTATQSEFLGTAVELARLQDEVSAAEQGSAHARNALSRWIGDQALRPVCPDLPLASPLPEPDQVQARALQHPALAASAAKIASAQASIALAQAAYRPDWRLQLAYAERPEFAEMLTLQVGVDLPLFAANRQDRGLAAALARKDAAESAAEDLRRQLAAEARVNHQDWQRLSRRLQAYEEQLLPQSAARVEAALAGWRAGRSTLREVLDARRAALEIRRSQLELRYDQARHGIQLEYLGAYDSTPATAENPEHE